CGSPGAQSCASDLTVMSRTCTILLLFTALAASLGFNLDTQQMTDFHVDSPGFGHSVVQYTNSRVMVGAPKEIKATNRTGGLYQCNYPTRRCEPVPLQVPPEAVNMSLGLSLAAATNPSQLLACGPTVHQACRQNMYLMGLCFLLASPGQGSKKLPDSLQECPRQDHDIVFLIDGSGSITRIDFTKMKSFVKSVMSQFQRPSTQVSLVQFSSRFQIHFTFKDFVSSSDPLGLVNSVSQLGGYTHTATAIRNVVNQLFTTQNGARRDATKILIVITDGQKTGDALDYKDVIPMAEAAGIIRYAIGVGSAFQHLTSRNELNWIASGSSYIFKVENFDALKAIQNQLKEKIFAIEGTQMVSSSSFELEMSQEGFSAAFTPDGPVLGAVGSFDWSGGAFLYPPNGSPTFINMSQEHVDMRDSYLGYATELALWKGVQSLVLGAPRHQHIGKVIIFIHATRQWRPQAEVTGTQIGSYFGASLCSVDVDRDGITDLVLIGAPHYYEPTQGGQVSVCPLPKGRARWRCDALLQGEQGHPWGRFGAALTVLGDVNGDKLTDVAIGAPGEEENQGAVYVFHGVSGQGISWAHSQRVTGSQLLPGLQHFGQSLSGGQDLTLDGLVDLAVGSQGHVLLLRTRPVLRVGVTMSFTRAEIPRSMFECQEQAASIQDLGDAIVCFDIYESTKSRGGNLQSSVTFELTLDPGRLSPRATFKETNTRTLTRVQVFELSRHCETLQLLLRTCVEDSVTPITLRLNFSLEGNPIPSLGGLQPVLASDARTYFTASLPFEKNCGDDHICQDDLAITFGFLGLKTLVVGSNLELNIEVTVSNDGEDSYGTTVTLFYPEGLSYLRVARQQITINKKKENQQHLRSLRLTCDSAPNGGQAAWSTYCSINHLILPGGTQVSLAPAPGPGAPNQPFLISSENNTPRTSKTTFQLELPVKYAVYTVISRYSQAPLHHSDWGEGGLSPHTVNNLGQRDLPVTVNFWVPVGLNGIATWAEMEVSHPQNPSIQCSSEQLIPTEADFQTYLQKNPEAGVCSLLPGHFLNPELPLEPVPHISPPLLQTLQKKVLVVSVAEITFNRSMYSQLPGQEAFLRAQMKTMLEKYEIHNPIPLIVGSCVGGLLLLALITASLYKVGFFKRQYKEMMEEANGQLVPEYETQDPQVVQ
uniref:VWFA domain-containing protein n=1 Tax=Cavia porcellus TaxID=10141 RepID=H0VTJ2_CAVPO